MNRPVGARTVYRHGRARLAGTAGDARTLSTGCARGVGLTPWTARRLGRCPGLHHERGLALVLTLFVVALVSVLVLEYHFDASVELDLAANYANDVQGYHLALDGVRFAQALLQRDSPKADGAKDDWYKIRFAPLLFGSDCIAPQQLLDLAQLSGLQEAVASGQDLSTLLERRAEEPSGRACVRLLITDEGGKLPVNALLPRGTGDTAQPDPTWVRIFEAFFDSFQIEPEVVDALVDWLDANDTPYRTGGAEGSYYERLPVPYTAKNSPMSTAGELRLVKGLHDPETVAKFFPGVTPEASQYLDFGSNQYLTPFPFSGTEPLQARVNVNTAPEPVLLALFVGATQDGARASVDTAIENIVKKRLEGEQFASINEALRGITGNALTALRTIVDVKSSYFRVESEGRLGVVKKRIVAVIKRAPVSSASLSVPQARQSGRPLQPAQQQQTSIVYFKVE